MTYKIKLSFFHSIFEGTGNSQGYSGVVGTVVSKEIFEKIVADDKELAKRFEQDGVIPNAIKTVAEIKAEIEELTKILNQKDKTK